jgi:hypothetical protein
MCVEGGGGLTWAVCCVVVCAGAVLCACMLVCRCARHPRPYHIAGSTLIAQLNADRTLATMLSLGLPQLLLESQAIYMQHTEGMCGGGGVG